MAYSPEKAAAYEKVEEAINDLLESFGTFEEGEFLTGWTIVVSGVRMVTESDYDEDGPDETDDENNVISRYTYFRRRGQDPTMTRGMVEELLDMIRS